jgi:ABC-2 type transport system ATP-binding protein
VRIDVAGIGGSRGSSASVANDAAAAVSVRGLARSFGKPGKKDERVAVAGLDFEVRPGELFGLVGPDGAGKTTTLRMLAGVLRPSAGDAILDGISVVADPEAVKPRLAYMSQRFGLYTDLTVDENLDFYADLFRVPRSERAARRERLFAFSNLGPFRDRLAGALSGGMKQKLGLSCALIHEPRVLLLDEPTFGVDPVSRRDLWRIVHEMVGRGVTAIVSTAYLDEAERFDRLALLHDGRLLALDSPRALAAGFKGELLEVRLPRARAARPVVEALPGVVRAQVFGDTLHVTVEPGEPGAFTPAVAATAATPAIAAIASHLAAAGHPATGIAPIAPSLEDLFLARIAEAEGIAA